jgi:hypothetical protein
LRSFAHSGIPERHFILFLYFFRVQLFQAGKKTAAECLREQPKEEPDDLTPRITPLLPFKLSRPIHFTRTRTLCSQHQYSK